MKRSLIALLIGLAALVRLAPMSKATYVPPSPYGGYVLSYFTGNNAQDQKLSLAVSYDGLKWTSVARRLQLTVNGRVVCLRDPYIVRKMDGTFALIASHSDASNNWSWSDIYCWDSTDLVTFTHGRAIPTGVPGGNWAPECIWDNNKRQYLIYFSNGENANGVYGCYTSDFHSVNGLRHLINLSGTSIDGDMVNGAGTYYLFLKSEATWRITQYSSKDLVNWTPMSPALPASSVEGPACLPSLDGAKWYLYQDWIIDHATDESGGWALSISSSIANAAAWVNQYSTSGTSIAQNGYSLCAGVRHGNAVRVTAPEIANILAKTYAGDAFYRIIDVKSGTALSCKHGGTADNTPLILHRYLSAPDQYWQLIDQGTGYYKLKNFKSGALASCLGGGGTANGTNGILHQDLSAKDQYWQIARGAMGGLKITNQQSGRALSCNNGATINNTQIHLRDYMGASTDQNWKIIKTSPPSTGFNPSIYYKVINFKSSTALSCYHGNMVNNTQLILYDFISAADQCWQIEDQGNGYFKLKNKRSGLLASSMSGGGTATNGTNGILYQDHGGKDQYWKIARGVMGGLKIINQQSGRALSCNNGATINNTQIHLWDYLGDSPDQEWIIEPAN